MFRYNLFQQEWLALIFFGGIALVLFVSLFYFDMSKKRDYDASNGALKTNYLSTWQGIPWTVKITIVLIVVFVTAFSVFRIIHPKSW